MRVRMRMGVLMRVRRLRSVLRRLRSVRHRLFALCTRGGVRRDAVCRVRVRVRLGQLLVLLLLLWSQGMLRLRLGMRMRDGLRTRGWWRAKVTRGLRGRSRRGRRVDGGVGVLLFLLLILLLRAGLSALVRSQSGVAGLGEASRRHLAVVVRIAARVDVFLEVEIIGAKERKESKRKAGRRRGRTRRGEPRKRNRRERGEQIQR
jgi:hypothetical protein